MEKFIIPPDQDGYSVTDGNETVSTILDGGLSRTRRDILGASSLVTTVWTLGREDYRYIRAFYRGVTGKGAEPFLIDLLLDFPTLTEHKAKFVVGSMALTQQDGLKFEVTAQLEVEPLPADDDFDRAYAMIYGVYGFEEWDLVYNQFNHLVNEVMPASLV